MITKNIKLVIFDLDGVITNTAYYHYMAWKTLADKLGIYFDEEINERLKGVSRLDSLKIILEMSERNYSDEELNIFTDEKNENYKKLISKIKTYDLLPGTKEVLEKLRKINIRIGLASVSRNVFTVVENLKIQNMFDYIADPSKIKKGKPDPEIFLTVAERLDIDPVYCMGVEDSKAGIISIKSAGMYALGIGEKSVLSQADDVISGLHEFDLRKYNFAL
jgi:beta-phosphoglucomutase